MFKNKSEDNFIVKSKSQICCTTIKFYTLFKIFVIFIELCTERDTFAHTKGK